MSIVTILALIIWTGSVAGIVWMLRKKMPLLARLPEGEVGAQISLPSAEQFSRWGKTFLGKIFNKTLIKLHTLSLKTENRIFSWRNKSRTFPQGIREKVRDKSNGASSSGKETPRPRTQDPYWRELKKSRKR